MLFTMFLGGRLRKLMLIRVGLLGLLVVVALAFHLSGTALVDLRIARVVLLVGFGVGFAVVSRRRRREAAGSDPVRSETGLAAGKRKPE